MTELNQFNLSYVLKDKEVIFRGRRFIQTTWNGISVIRDLETGYYQASKACLDNHKEIKHWRENKGTQEYLEVTSLEYKLDIVGEVPEVGKATSSLMYRILPGYQKDLSIQITNEIQGYYIHPNLFHDVCYWANKPYAVKVSRLMNLINERNRLLNQTLEQTIAQLQAENNRLKQEKSDLEDIVLEQTLDKEFLSYDNSKLQAQVKDLNSPINQSIQPSSIYASPVGKNHFQLRFSKETISKHSKIKNLHHVEMINAKDVLEMTRKELKKNNETSKLNGKVVLPTSKLDQTFNLIDEIKQGKIKLPTKEEINSFIDKSIIDLHSRKLTPQVKGKMFELNQLKNGNYIPWNLLPKSFLEGNNEQSRDCGIDGIKFNETSIEEIVQIKYHNKPSYLNFNEIKMFMIKAQQERYGNIKKRLVLHGCKLGKQFKAKMNELGIAIEIV